MNSANLDRYITGNWGEDSVPPEFVRARELGDLGMEVENRIDVSRPTDERQIVATVRRVSVSSGFVTVEAKEFEWPFLIPEDAIVYFADDEE